MSVVLDGLFALGAFSYTKKCRAACVAERPGAVHRLGRVYRGVREACLPRKPRLHEHAGCQVDRGGFSDRYAEAWNGRVLQTQYGDIPFKSV